METDSSGDVNYNWLFGIWEVLSCVLLAQRWRTGRSAGRTRGRLRRPFRRPLESLAACRSRDGTDMNRVFVIAASGLALAGCASGTDWLPKFEPAPVSIQFQSEPAGAEAKLSTGGGCQTPCALSVAPDKEFSVTFSLAGYQPQTVAVQLTKPQGIETALQPNPVAVDLAAAPKTPPKRTPARRAATTTSAAPKPAAARPAAPRPAVAAPTPAATAPAAPPPPANPWPPVR